MKTVYLPFKSGHLRSGLNLSFELEVACTGTVITTVCVQYGDDNVNNNNNNNNNNSVRSLREAVEGGGGEGHLPPKPV
jgi:hypothetical protein